ncbi:MAG: ABC transporter ATP-binding protein [Thermoanaerobaculia bacterium]|nr:ABC transporter ATP-binding protein [Thermoanaerobaculia bacterium]
MRPSGGTIPIDLSHVGVCFRVPNESIHSFKEYVLQRLQGRLKYRDLWALQGVDLMVRAGEFFGIVGRNGAGKSTLLRVISRILRPTSGRVIVRGSVVPLLELNAGFHPDLTGRENIYLNAGLLGFSRSEVDQLFDWVVGFAELEEFIHLPLRKYSAGMIARLGFSVASMVQPDILVLDEYLAVGDPAFQRKSLERINNFCRRGSTILLASHSLEQVEHHCDRVAWIEHGRLRALGPVTDVLPEYRRSMES